MKDPVTIKHRVDYLKRQYGDRNTQYQINQWAYDGEFDKIMGIYEQPGFGGLDNRNRRSSKIQSWNMMKPVVDFTVIQLARMPTIVVPTGKSGDDTAKAKSTLVEYFLYWNWDQSFMETRSMEAAFSLGSRGSACHQLIPDFATKRIIMRERLPEHCYPMPSGDGQTYEWVGWSWTEEAEALIVRYPQLKNVLPRKGNRYDKLVDIIEWQDKDDYGFIIGGAYTDGLAGYTHNLGFVPVTVTPCMKFPGPNKVFGPADIDQLIAINIVMNTLQTKVQDALEENLYPSLYTIGDEEPLIDRAPGTINYLGPPGSDVKRLDPPNIPQEVWVEMQRFEDFIRVHANWSEAWSGQISQSQASGAAIKRLQSPATGMAGIRQSLMGQDLRQMNRWWLQMYEHFFPEEKYDCVGDGNKTALSAPRKPMEYAVQVIPKSDIAGYHRNTLEYSVFGSDLNSTLVAIQQLKQLGFVSNEWCMSQIPGITDEQGMKDQIHAEKREEIQFEGELQMLLEKIKTQAIIEQQNAMVQAQAQIQGMQGQAGGQPGGAPGSPEQTPGVPGNVSVLPQGQPQVMGVGQPLSASGQPGEAQEVGGLPYTNLKPFGQALGAMQGGGGPPAQGAAQQAEKPAMVKETEPNMVRVADVTAAVQGINKRIQSGEIRSRSGGLKGNVWLLGDLVERGSTMGTIEIGVSLAADGQLITNALTQYRGRLSINTFTRPPEPEDALLIVEGGENAVSEQTQVA